MTLLSAIGWLRLARQPQGRSFLLSTHKAGTQFDAPESPRIDAIRRPGESTMATR